MTTEAKPMQRKLSLLELADFLRTVSEACRIHGCSHQHFYDIKKAYESQGLEGLKEKTGRKPCLLNRVAPEIAGYDAIELRFLPRNSLSHIQKAL